MQRDDNNRDNRNQRWIDIPTFVNSGSEVNQMSSNIKKRNYDYDDSNTFVKEVNSSLAKQVRDDLERKPKSGSSRKRKKKKRSTRVLKVLLFTLLTVAVLGCILVFTPAGKKLVAKIATEYIYHNLDYQKTDKTDKTDSTAVSTKPADKIVNILLIGIEEIKNAKNTDSMIIATMNTETHTLKLTSLMRDLYVDIPGYDKGRLNSAYSKGGIDKLYSTIETNFGIKMDGYCMVNFEKFQQIVDMIGGVKVTLTQNEANYLNTTNYISKKQFRKVKAGTQTLNGNQALGYCRVRKRSTSTESNDFGRTQRQRIVLKAIYSKIMHKNILELPGLMNKILHEVRIQTDITKAEFERYFEEAMDLKVKDLESHRIPADGSYKNETHRLGSVNQEVLVPTDWNATRQEIHDFIYGNASGKETSKDNATAIGKTSDSGSTQ